MPKVLLCLLVKAYDSERCTCLQEAFTPLRPTALGSGDVPGLWQQLGNLRVTSAVWNRQTLAVKGKLYANTQDNASASGQTHWKAAQVSYLYFCCEEPTTGGRGRVRKGFGVHQKYLTSRNQ